MQAERFSRLPPSSPRTWGCFSTVAAVIEYLGVFPTHVGVFPARSRSVLSRYCLPHARGGVSSPQFKALREQASSPRTWGCFHRAALSLTKRTVFPTHVGVFLQNGHLRDSCTCLPHARGGVSIIAQLVAVFLKSSPRTWGCFYAGREIQQTPAVFPTHVGVFLRSLQIQVAEICLPHARGGVSKRIAQIGRQQASSPRTWGCFR